MKPFYAIDFGTSNSVLGAAIGPKSLGFAPLDPLASDHSILRTLLYFPNASEVFFGTRAIQEFANRDFTGRFVRSIKKQLPSRSFVGTFIDNRPLNLEDLIATFLSEMRRRADAHFQIECTSVVLGRPARFAMDEADDRFAEGRLLQAARLAGFKEIHFLAEPVAAALGYAETGAAEEIILAADYGGGTSDFTIYKLRHGAFKPEDVLGIGGVPTAGDALDAAIMRNRVALHFGTGVQYKVPFGSNVLTMPKHLMERICHPAEISLLRKQDTYEFLQRVQQWSLGKEDGVKMDRLFTLLNDQLGFSIFERIEAAKRALSTASTTEFRFEYPSIDLREEITRIEFENYAEPDFELIENALNATLSQAQIKPDKITKVLCTGGTGRVPKLRESLISRFGKEKLVDLDPFRGVAKGLLTRAAQLT